MDSTRLEQEREQVFEQLKGFIAEIIGADVVEELEVTKDSNFTRDLEMDSIEIVAFAEKVKQTYGEDIDYAKWLSEMDLDQLINLTVDDLINFIVDARHSNK